MLSELLGCAAKAAARKCVRTVEDRVFSKTGIDYSVASVKKFQKLVRGMVFRSLINEIEESIPEEDDPKVRYHVALKTLREHIGDICTVHNNRKRKFREAYEREVQDQLGNKYPDYARAKECERLSMIEAFMVVVMHEWMKRGDFILEPDEDVDTDEFEVWSNSIEDAIRIGIVAREDIAGGKGK